MKTDAEAMSDALEILQKRGWAKGAGEDEHGRVCAQRAMTRSTRSVWSRWFYDADRERQRRRLENTYIEVANELFPVWDFGWGGVPSFNDHRDTTREDVEQAFEKSIRRLEEVVQ